MNDHCLASGRWATGEPDKAEHGGEHDESADYECRPFCSQVSIDLGRSGGHGRPWCVAISGALRSGPFASGCPAIARFVHPQFHRCWTRMLYRGLQRDAGGEHHCFHAVVKRQGTSIDLASPGMQHCQKQQAVGGCGCDCDQRTLTGFL
jgi:hypothetical protein